MPGLVLRNGICEFSWPSRPLSSTDRYHKLRVQFRGTALSAGYAAPEDILVNSSERSFHIRVARRQAIIRIDGRELTKALFDYEEGPVKVSCDTDYNGLSFTVSPPISDHMLLVSMTAASGAENRTEKLHIRLHTPQSLTREITCMQVVDLLDAHVNLEDILSVIKPT